MTARNGPESREVRFEDLLRHLTPRPRWQEDEVMELAYDGAHLSTEDIFDFWEGNLRQACRERVEEHAERCEYCLHRLGEIGDLVRGANVARLKQLQDPLRDYLLT